MGLVGVFDLSLDCRFLMHHERDQDLWKGKMKEKHIIVQGVP